MSTYFNDIQAALDTQLNTRGEPIAFPNVPFKPVNGTPYLRPTFFPADTVQASMGANGKDETNGVYQVEVIIPLGSGRPQLVDTVADLFRRGTVLTYNGVNVRIRSVSVGLALALDQTWYSVPVSANFFTYTEARS